jgi:steroid delta-isomerase-like uncharacterized protein
MTDPKEIARAITEDPWRGKLDETVGLIGDDYVGHVPGMPLLQGPEGFRGFLETYLNGFPDGSITAKEQIAEGDLVATRWIARGTNTGEMMGMPPTGKEVTVEGISMSRISDGKAHEAWITWDTLSMLQQLGVVPETATVQA